MRVIDINVSQVDDETRATANIVVETQRGNDWIRGTVYPAVARTTSAQRKITLADNERLVIEPIVYDDLVYDTEQMMARPKTREERNAEQKAIGAAPHVTASPNLRPAAAAAKPLPSIPTAQNQAPLQKASPTLPAPTKIEAEKKAEAANKPQAPNFGGTKEIAT